MDSSAKTMRGYLPDGFHERWIKHVDIFNVSTDGLLRLVLFDDHGCPQPDKKTQLFAVCASRFDNGRKKQKKNID